MWTTRSGPATACCRSVAAPARRCSRRSSSGWARRWGGRPRRNYPIDPETADWEQRAQQALESQRRQVADALAGTGLGWTYHASRADPVRLIAAVADEHDALMIIVGTRGEGFGATIERLMGRSVSRGVIGSQHRPVLVVPAPEP